MSKESCTKEQLKKIFLTDWAFVAYAMLFAWLSGFGPLLSQVWRVGGLSFTLSTLDIARLAVGFVGFLVCIFILFKMQRNSCKECEVTKLA